MSGEGSRDIGTGFWKYRHTYLRVEDAVYNMVFPNPTNQSAFACNAFTFKANTFCKADGRGIVRHDIRGDPVQVQFVKCDFDTFAEGFRSITVVP